MDKNNVFKITVKIEKKEFEEGIKEAFNKKQKDIKLDGFRAGKVPFDVYLKKVGKESLYMDAVDILLPNAYRKALEEKKLIPIIEPAVDLKKIDEDGVEFEFTITTMPEVKIKKYKGLKVKKDKVEVTKEDIDNEVNSLLEKYSEMVIKENGEVVKGDVAIIDFEGFKDGVAFDGGKGENYPLEIGSNTFIPGFEEQLIGMKKGDSKDVNVTFPEDYNSPDLAGKPVVFKVTINEVKNKIRRELDEEFFADLALPGVESRETLEAEIKSSIEVNKKQEIENKYVDDLLAEIAKNTEVDIPEELVHEEIHNMMHRYEEQLKMQGLSLDLYYELTKTTSEDLHNQMEGEAKNHITYRFILETIKEKEKISATQEEAEKEMEELANKYNMELEEFKKMYGSINMMIYELEIKKVIDFLKENN